MRDYAAEMTFVGLLIALEVATIHVDSILQACNDAYTWLYCCQVSRQCFSFACLSYTFNRVVPTRPFLRVTEHRGLPVALRQSAKRQVILRSKLLQQLSKR